MLEVRDDWPTARRVRRVAIVGTLVADVMVVFLVDSVRVFRCVDGYSNRGGVIRWAFVGVVLFAGPALASVVYGHRHDGLTRARAWSLATLIGLAAIATLAVSWYLLVNATTSPCYD